MMLKFNKGIGKSVSLTSYSFLQPQIFAVSKVNILRKGTWGKHKCINGR
jgi:hypothetical protein